MTCKKSEKAWKSLAAIYAAVDMTSLNDVMISRVNYGQNWKAFFNDKLNKCGTKLYPVDTDISTVLKDYGKGNARKIEIYY